jgi:MinD-like ATPase involved in chromosome partitioning or flagellar assembly
VLTRIGIRTKPSPAEQALRSDVRMVSQHWPGPRTIAIANGKGSANKTPTMVCLSAVFGRYGGTGVLGWDNNETRGTAAWRTQQGPHTSTALDLLPHCDELLGTAAQAAQLAAYVHHQVEDKFDVLWSDQSIEGEHEIAGEEVDAVHQVASKYYRLILMDSGNNERASNWRAMIGHANQLVVPCTNVEDTAEAGARMLEALTQRNEHSAQLAQNAVAIVSQRTPGRDPDMSRIAAGFEPLVRRVVTIPHDPALYSGVIRFASLRPATQRAWLAAGAAVAEGL